MLFSQLWIRFWVPPKLSSNLLPVVGSTTLTCRFPFFLVGMSISYLQLYASCNIAIAIQPILNYYLLASGPIFPHLATFPFPWQSCHTMSFVTVELHSELPFKAIYVLFLSLPLFSHELLGYVTKHCHHCISQHPTLLLTHQMDLDFSTMQPLKWKEPCS